MTHARKSIALAMAGLTLLSAGLTLLPTGCGTPAVGGDKSSASGGNATVSATTYANEEYGFSITYSNRFTEVEPASSSNTADGELLDVVFADKHKTVLPTRYTDLLRVSVYGLTRSVKPSEVPGIRRELQDSVDQMMSSLPAGRVVKKLSPVELRGVPGFAFKYTYSQDGARLIAVTLFLVRGSREYQITAQATADDWDDVNDELQAALASFTVD